MAEVRHLENRHNIIFSSAQVGPIFGNILLTGAE